MVTDMCDNLGVENGCTDCTCTDSHMEGRGCSSDILNLTPKRDQSGRGQPLCRHLKETSLKYRLVKQ